MQSYHTNSTISIDSRLSMESKATYSKVSEHPAQKLFFLNSFQYKWKHGQEQNHLILFEYIWLWQTPSQKLKPIVLLNLELCNRCENIFFQETMARNKKRSLIFCQIPQTIQMLCFMCSRLISHYRKIPNIKIVQVFSHPPSHTSCSACYPPPLTFPITAITLLWQGEINKLNINLNSYL